MKFKLWLDWADFGFQQKKLPAAEPNSENPINPIDSHVIMTELSRMPPIGNKKGRWTWQDIIEWGEGVGAIKTDVSPLGSYKIVCRKLIKNLLGENIWICKSVKSLNENEHNQNEVPLAHEIYDNIVIIEQEMLDSPSENYPNFKRLVQSLNNTLKKHHPEIMIYQGVKEINEYYSKIWFEYRGHGVEIDSSRAEQFNIDINFSPEAGVIYCWGYEITSPTRQHTWSVQPSEWNEYFAPSQSIPEITKCVKNTFMTY